MLKICFLQSLFRLSDPDMEDNLYENITFQLYCKIDIATDNIPDETTILNFRHLLEKYKLQHKFLEITNKILEENKILLKNRTIVDATIINTPSSTKNEDKKRDPEMHSTKKWNQRYFGWKTHIWVDKDSGLVHTVEIMWANTHDSKKRKELITVLYLCLLWWISLRRDLSLWTSFISYLIIENDSKLSQFRSKKSIIGCKNELMLILSIIIGEKLLIKKEKLNIWRVFLDCP